MITARDILLGVLLPAAVAGAVLLAGVLLGSLWRLRRALTPLGIAAGFVAGYAALLRVPAFPPLDSVDWLFYAAGGLGVIGALDALFWRSEADPSPRWLAASAAPRDTGTTIDYQSVERDAAGGRSAAAWIARIVIVASLLGLLAWLLARPLLVFHWIGAVGPIWIAGIALAMAVLWLMLDTLAAREALRGRGHGLAIAFALVAGLSAITIMLSGSQKLGQLAGMLAAALLALAVLGPLVPRVQVARGQVLLYVVLHTSLVVTATEHLYASLTTLNAVLLLCAAPLAWLGELLPAPRPLLRAVVQVVAAVTPAAVAATFAAFEFARAAGYPAEPL